MIAWHPFEHDGQTYDLTHLHPYVCSFEQPAKETAAARQYEVQVFFSLHCFTRKPEAGDDVRGPLAYRDKREVRIFDFGRYELSHRLPLIIRSLPHANCYHTERGNFFTVCAVDEKTGLEVSYEIYFAASRSGTNPGRLNLFVQSAYVRDRQHNGNKPTRKKIGFFVILYNTLTDRVIKAPK